MNTNVFVGRGYRVHSNQIVGSLNKLQTQINAVQYYMTNYEYKNVLGKLINRQLSGTKQMYIVIHGKLVYNLSNPKLSQVKLLFNELDFANRFGADVVIHQGKSLKDSTEHAIATFVDNIHQVLELSDKAGHTNKIVLENSSHEGTALGYTWEQLAQIDQLIDRPDRIGYCIDTAHAFAAGELDTRDPKKVELSIARFDKLIGLNRVSVIHFNDSKKPWESRVDAHENMLMGYISSPAVGGPSGLRRLAEIANQHHIPLILETPHDDETWLSEIQMVTGWANGSDKGETAHCALLEDVIEIKGQCLSKAVLNKSKPNRKVKSERKGKVTKSTICQAVKKNGDQCTYKAKPGSTYCGVHKNYKK